MIDRAWSQRLKLICDKPFPNFPFNFNLRRYTKENLIQLMKDAKVGWCKLNGIETRGGT
jgi:hypothetical protein